MVNLFEGKYKGKTVLITGHTGFKGAWMSHWLIKMGANVIGLSKEIPGVPNHFNLLKDPLYVNLTGDIRDLVFLKKVFSEYKIDIVFHLAAQSLVRHSYSNPLETIGTNVIGTANLIDCCKNNESTKGIIVVTSDKCYENFEDNRAYSEEDRMGGYDPYSASKGCAELLASCYRRSYFPVADFGIKHNFIIATARAGNVIGGGDWSLDRLIPDIVKNANESKSTEIRSLFATRPWQHVLEPISGYLMLGMKILKSDISVSSGWNFGPHNEDSKSVEYILQKSSKFWEAIKYHEAKNNNVHHEANLLRLDCTKAFRELKWSPVWNTDKAIEITINWYKQYYKSGKLCTDEDIKEYIKKAKALNLTWV